MSSWNAAEQILYRPQWWIPAAAGLFSAIKAFNVIGNKEKRALAPAWIASSAMLMTIAHIHTSSTRAAFFQIEGIACGGCWGLKGSYIFDFCIPPIYLLTILLISFSRTSFAACQESSYLRHTFTWWIATGAVLWAHGVWSISAFWICYLDKLKT